MHRDIRKIVKDGYEQGDYPRVFRRDGPPNEMERQFLDRLLSLCPITPRVLDLGCGTGLPIDKYLADHGADVAGVDISPKHIALARANVPSASYVEGDFSQLALTAGSFDAVVSFHGSAGLSITGPTRVSQNVWLFVSRRPSARFTWTLTTVGRILSVRCSKT